MFTGIVLRRIRREWRLMSVLLLALTLVSAFLALGPMFVRTVASADIEIRLQNLTPREARIDFSDLERFDSELMTTAVKDAFGARVETFRNFATSEGLLCPLNFYSAEEPQNAPRYTSCYRPYSYPELSELFELVDGRLPHMRDDGVIEVLIERSIVDKSAFLDGNFSLGPGSLIRGGVAVEGASSQPTTQLEFEIVGVVAARTPSTDPFWDNQAEIFGTTVVGQPSQAPDELHFGLIMLRGAFDTLVKPEIAGTRYTWRASLDTSLFSLDDLRDFETNLASIREQLVDDHPRLRIDTGINRLIDRFNANVSEGEQPILLLSVLILVLMVYNLVTIVSLVFEQQSREWAMMASRGGSSRQLVVIQFLTVTILALLAFLLGPPAAYGILLLLTNIGPQSAAIDPHHIGSIPVNAYLLSGAAALISLTALTLPAVPMARDSFLRIRQSVSRPPLQPAWQRYFLDVVFVGLGLLFTMRLYLLITGAAGDSGADVSLDTLFTDPQTLTRLITGAGSTLSLSDPFSLLGPVLIIAGLSLLWIRLFPYFVRLLGQITRGLNALTVRLALWSVEREPGHYAQLVLLLIGTLALGTASLSLSHTRELNAWQQALNSTGADVRLLLDSETLETRIDYVQLTESLSGVTASVPMLYARQPVNNADFFGVETERIADDGFTAIYPEYQTAFERLQEAEPAQYAGEILPLLSSGAEIAAFALDVYVQPDGDDGDAITTTGVVLRLLNDQQQLVEVNLQPDSNPSEMVTGQWLTYRGTIPARHYSESWRVMGLEFVSRRSESVGFDDHYVHVDNLRALDRNGEATLIEGWESTGDGEDAAWQRETLSSVARSILFLASDQGISSEGDTSLRVGYGVSSTLPTRARINYSPVQTVIPVLISPSFAALYGGRLPLEAGDEAISTVDLMIGSEEYERILIRYRVVDIIEEFPISDGLFFVASLDDLLYVLNTGIAGTTFGQNELWVMLENREPSAIFRAVAGSAPGVLEAGYAWDRYTEIQRDPISNSVSGMLFAGFWVSLALIVIDFAFYLTMVMHRRAVSFAVLRSMGWENVNIWRMLTIEQAAFIAPALLIGVLLGVMIAYIIRPFLAAPDVSQLMVPLLDVFAMLTALVLVFGLMLLIVANRLRRSISAGALRFGD